LVALCLLVGIFPEQTVRPLLDLGVRAMLGFDPDYSLALWHGFSLPVLMSLIALAGGVLLYAARQRLFAWHDRVFPPASGAGIFQRLLFLLLVLANAAMQHRLASNSLQRATAWLIATAVALAVLPVLLTPYDWSALARVPLAPVDAPSLLAAAMLAVATVGVAVCRRQRLHALLLLGVVGLLVSLAFVHFSAPDLALTQLSVEVVTTILMLLVLYFLPQREAAPIAPGRRARDLLLAGAAGLGAAALTLAVATRHGTTALADYLLAQAKPAAGANNVVNAILVDFRGFDTLGEIAVLAIAAAGIFGMLVGIRLRVPRRDPRGRPWSPDAHPTILAMLSRPLLPLALLVAVFILLRGHHAPGGGFIAGLVAAIALILQQLASGQQWSAQRLRLRYPRLIGTGLLLAALTAAAALLFGRPALTSAIGHWTLPVLGEIEWASVMLFDLGVFLVVLGTAMLILDHLGRLSAPARRSGARPADHGE